jgi:glycosyltransferase involved in cell wall biosynthesis
VSRLVVIVPVLGRPHRVEPLLASISSATPAPHRVVFIADPGDEEQIAAVMRAGAGLIVHGGSYAAKINAGIRCTSEPLIFTGADDLAFRPGWLVAARALMVGPVQVVGVNDLGTRRVREGRHATHFLVDRRYLALGTIDEPDSGKLMHEGYPHEWTDDELVATARARGAIAFATDAVVEHLHPSFGRAPEDATYRIGRATREAGRALFRSREALWAG